MRKEIILSNGVIIIEIENNDYIPFMTIKRAYRSKGSIEKIITFSIWDDISFNAFSKINLDSIDFEFNNEDSFYQCLDKLLNENKKIIIYDDHTADNDKYMCIYKKDNLIGISFKGNKNANLKQDKFNIFIKNIGPDARSKIHDDKFKLRIVDFFADLRTTLLEEQKILKKEKELKNERV